MEAIVRAARLEDVEAMHRVRQAVVENRLSDPERATEQSYAPYVSAAGAWVAEINGEVAGFAALDSVDESVWALFVHPAAEAAGLGKAHRDRLLDRARERGLKQLFLSTSADTRAERFYLAAGWTAPGRTAAGEARFERAVE